MADNIPNVPTGAVPPKKETGKVQPKKETVRINLPPKPSAAPTIKLPTLPPGGPTGAGSAPAPALHAPVAIQRPGTAAPVAPRPAPPSRQQASPVLAAAPKAGTLDTILAIAATVAALAAVASSVILYMLLNDALK
jgi:hypothetical protein